MENIVLWPEHLQRQMIPNRLLESQLFPLFARSMIIALPNPVKQPVCSACQDLKKLVGPSAIPGEDLQRYKKYFLHVSHVHHCAVIKI